MSQQSQSAAQREERQSIPPLNRWNSVWTNNKGIFLIILAQAVGSTMDATVRFLQQGGHGMHPFQVRNYQGSRSIHLKSYLLYVGYFRPHEHDLSAELPLHVEG